MIYYASSTGTRRNLALFKEYGWRVLCTPFGNGPQGFRYAIDNGAWRAYQQRIPFNEDLFRKHVDNLGAGADWVVLPDIVASPVSLEFSLHWLDDLRQYPLLLAVQDGMNIDEVWKVVEREALLGLFVGGSTDWKLRTMCDWCQLPCYVHIGRVNTQRRWNAARLCGADSCDGSGVSKWARHCGRMATVTQQGVLKL